jgi:hypothetical protein
MRARRGRGDGALRVAADAGATAQLAEQRAARILVLFQQVVDTARM